ncbi:hypothetical protein B0T18DRAFT_483671 [Schizothecium vesticola]|uniref:Uncharacterized protein n=1 Tax=Schizothecium vesticola TaxID=314040 RepID=A0AA40F7X3_9PEZI|nr:hypothetical protein B0T18DRAFT_483671 [Schizothecium vesticola]
MMRASQTQAIKVFEFKSMLEVFLSAWSPELVTATNLTFHGDFKCHYSVAGIPPTACAAVIGKLSRDLKRGIIGDDDHNCDVGVRVDVTEKHIPHGRRLVATAAAMISQMEKDVADSDKALVEMESRWSYLAGADNVNRKTHAIFQDRVDHTRACRTGLEAECAIKSKRLVECQEKILEQLSAMETGLAVLKAEKRARDEGLDRHTWPVHRALDPAEYAKELMLHLSNKLHQTRTAKGDLAQEIDKRDARVRDKDVHIARIYPRIIEVDDTDELLECQLCKKKTKFGKKVGRDQTLACLECIVPA